MPQVAGVFDQFRSQVSLRQFMRVVEQPYWRLRDYLKSAPGRLRRQAELADKRERVNAAALAEPTYGYRRVYAVLQRRGDRIGRDQVRWCLNDLGLQQKVVKKPRRKTIPVTEGEAWPEGRRVQLDATRLTLSSGISWVYLVEDVTSRLGLASGEGPNVNQERAAQTLRAGRDRLREVGIDKPLLVQSDGGSDFTSASFQVCCAELGQWVQCRVNQVGEMGILEQLNRTFKYDSVFRDEIETATELRAHLPKFEAWYNEERLHRCLGYQTPRESLLQEVGVLS